MTRLRRSKFRGEGIIILDTAYVLVEAGKFISLCSGENADHCGSARFFFRERALPTTNAATYMFGWWNADTCMFAAILLDLNRLHSLGINLTLDCRVHFRVSFPGLE